MSRRARAAAAISMMLLVVVVLVVRSRAAFDNNNATSLPASQSAGAPLEQRTKTAGCAMAGALPDHACTPGEVFEGVMAEKICASRYARSVRDVPVAEKDQVYAEYGIVSRQPGQYEVDHLISLELGGSNGIANLWPETTEPRPGYHEKDRFENYLHDKVCHGAISLSEAQRRIAEDWLKYWNEAGEP